VYLTFRYESGVFDMLTSRRSVCAGMAALLVGNNGVYAENEPLQPPKPEELQTGDFLWSKPPCSFVPFKVELDDGTTVSASQAWEHEKRAFIKRAKKNGTTLTSKQLSDIESLSFSDFLHQFHDISPEESLAGVDFHPYSAPGSLDAYKIAAFFKVYCGHAAIVGPLNKDKQPTVIEAQWQKTVVWTSYNDFLSEHSKDKIWYGRLNSFPDYKRASVAAEAMKYQGIPYDFFNFDLADSSSFYCSKLPWFCVFKALGISLDKDLESKRGFWFTPKQMMLHPEVTTVITPGKFGLPEGYCYF
jgi:Permuted papain-like amidase enzyme, YaeF/YiiX, C92 family